jgi:hypothetical protein
VRGVVVLARNKTVPTSSEGLREATVDLYIGERRVGTRTLDVGLGPISAAAYCGELRATSEWDDVAADAALTRVAGDGRARGVGAARGGAAHGPGRGALGGAAGAAAADAGGPRRGDGASCRR